MRLFLLSLLLLTTGLLTACSTGDDDDSSTPPANDDDASDDDDAAPAAPTVDSNIANDDNGVLATTPLVLTFSEPMSTASVEAAWVSDSLPANELTFNWNATGTILTVDMSGHIQYPNGGIDVDYMGYGFEIEASASSEAGEALEAPFSLNFNSARDITMALARFDDGTGSYNGSATGVDIRVGDSPDNGTWRGFLTIDLAELPAIVELTSASLFIRQSDVTGHPYVDLGDLLIDHMAPIEEISLSHYNGTAEAELGVFSDSDAQANPGGDRSIDVTASLQTDLDAGNVLSSYRFGFETAQDGESDDDYSILDRTSSRLDVRVLAE